MKYSTSVLMPQCQMSAWLYMQVSGVQNFPCVRCRHEQVKLAFMNPIISLSPRASCQAPKTATFVAHIAGTAYLVRPRRVLNCSRAALFPLNMRLPTAVMARLEKGWSLPIVDDEV